MGPSTLLSTGPRFTLLTIILIVAGAALRLTYATRCGVGYDEVFVMGVGLDEASASWRALVIDVPVRRSDGITPLWWWVQAVPSLVGGHPSLVGLRAVPVLLGIATLIVAWRVAARRIGRGPAAILLGLAAMSDVLAFSNARGEFAESLLIVVALPAACLAGQTRRPGLKGTLWLILLMTHLGKGLFLVAGLAMAEVICILLKRGRGRTVRAVRGLAISGLIAVVPTIAWLLVVNTVAFSSGPVATDAGDRDNVWHSLTAITFGYRQVKAHLVAGPMDAMQVYLDGAIWPTTTILAVPLLVGMLSALFTSGRRRVLTLSLMPWIVIGIVAVVARGMIGGRFHLLYLPALWIVAAVGLWRLRRAAGTFILGCGLVWIAHLGVAFSWSSWTERALGLGNLAQAAVALAIAIVITALLAWGRAGRRFPAVAIVGFLTLAVVLLGGPWRWCPAARFEPMAGPTQDQERGLLLAIDQWRSGRDQYPPPHGRTLYIDLANYFLRKDPASAHDLARALHYAELETDRAPNDARAWFYLGLARQRHGLPAEQVRQAWQRSYELGPDPRLAERLGALGEPSD
jgi:hypothetical protein